MKAPGCEMYCKACIAKRQSGGESSVVPEQNARIHLKNLSLRELESFVGSLGEEPFRARQLMRWLYGRGASHFKEMTDLANSFRHRLEESSWISSLKPEKVQSAADGTRKASLVLADGERIESVLLPEKDHFTLCLSSQVGCGLGCEFCLTGKKGWVRNLDSSEILDQILAMRSFLPDPARLTNLVLMGMGEPLNNFEEVTRALEIIRSPLGFQFSHRRVTVSTAGIIPRMEELGSRPRFVKLAVSLNASNEEQRTRLMPINRKYPLKDLLAACRRIPLENRERITFEYVLIQGVNDSEEDAQGVSRLLQGIKSKVNLIPFNEHPGCPWKRPEEQTVLKFRDVLMSRGFLAMVRQSKGRQILAACGQLGGGNP